MINLLPSEIKGQYRTKSVLYSLTLIYVIILVGLALGSAALATFNLTSRANISNKTETLAGLNEQAEKKQELILKAAFIEDRLKAESSQKSSPHWDAILASIASDTPANVQLTSININQDGSAFTLTLGGETNERRAIVLFKDKLEADQSFEKARINNITDSSTAEFKKYGFTITTEVKNAS